MGKNKRLLQKWMAAILSVGMVLPGTISIHADDEGNTPQTDGTAVTESVPSSSASPAESEPSSSPETRNNAVSSAESMPEPTSTPAPSPSETAVPTATPTPTAVPVPGKTPAPTSVPKEQNHVSSEGASEVNVYRLYNLYNGDHMYTTNASEKDHLTSLGWAYEGIGWISPSKGDPVYRLYNPVIGEHFYTVSLHERDVLGTQGWRKEGTGWYSDTLKRVKVYRDYNKSHDYTASTGEHNALLRQGWRSEGIAFYAMKTGSVPKPAPKDPKDKPSNGASAVNMYRMYNPNSREHFYTSSTSERDHLRSVGWDYEGVGWVSPSMGKPVYRLYNPGKGEHFYTMSAHERDILGLQGWRKEGTAWYSDTLKRVSVYRTYNPRMGKHHYTTSANERNNLIRQGWRNEGVAFYAMKPGWQRTYTHGNIPYYSQLDPRWANIRYGGHTIRDTGCGVTGISMIASSLVGRSVLPPEVASLLYSAGQYNVKEPGTTGTARLVAGAHYGLKVDKITSLGQLKTALRQGKIISEMTENSFANTSHGVVVFGNNNGYTNVFDPYFSRHNGSYSIDYMWRARAFSPDNYDAGAVLFAFYKN